MQFRDYVKGIADDIEALGHYQEPRDHMYDLWSLSNRRGRCCLYVNPTLQQLGWREREDIRDRLGTELGVESVVSWSNRTPTPGVVARLRKLQSATS